MARLLERNHPTPDSVDLSLTNVSPPDTCLKANPTELWAHGDPGSRLAPWLQEGAPRGLRIHPDLTGLFPLADNTDPQIAFDDLFKNFDTFANYSGVEENEDEARAIFGYVEKGYLSQHDTLESCVNELKGEQPVDAKKPQVTAATARRYKSELPRATDAVHDILARMSNLKTWGVTYAVGCGHH